MIHRYDESCGLSGMLPVDCRSSKMPRKILLVELKAALRPIVRERLRNKGYVAEYAMDADQALYMTARDAFDLVVLDVRSPSGNGFRVCREVRQRGSETPILMLTAVGKPAAIIAGLNMGADDYVASPLNMRELMTRIEVLLRRRRNARRKGLNVYEFGSIRVDIQAAETTRESNVVNLFAREFRLLRYFLEHPGVTFSREDLLSAVWGQSQKRPTRTVDMHIAALRRKLENQPRQPKHFLTVHRLGYKFRP